MWQGKGGDRETEEILRQCDISEEILLGRENC